MTQIVKALLKKDNWLRLQLGVAKELGYTLRELTEKMTESDLLLWSAYFELLNDEQEESMRRSRYR